MAKKAARERRRRPSITRFLFIASMTLMVSGVVVVGLSWTLSELIRYRNEADRITREYTDSRMRLLRNEISRVIDYIQYEKSKAEKTLKSQLKNRVKPVGLFLDSYVKDNNLSSPPSSLLTALYESIFSSPDEPAYPPLSIYTEEGELIMGGGQIPLFEKALSAANSGEDGGFFSGFPGNVNTDGRYIGYARRIEGTPLLLVLGARESTVMEQIKADVLTRINGITFDTHGYIFVVKYDGTMLSNRAAPERMGENMWNFRDPDGVPVIQKVIEAARNEAPDDFLRYSWWKPGGDITPKLSVSRGIDDWEWAVGAGVYLDDMREEIAALRRRSVQRILFTVSGIVVVLAGVIIIGFIISRRFSGKVRLSFERFFGFFREAAETLTEIDEEGFPYSEFTRLARSANDLVKKRNQVYSDLLEEERKLEESEKKYREIVENASSAIVKIRSDGTVLFVNEFAEKLFGYTQEEIVGKPDVGTIVPPRDSEGRDLNALIMNIIQNPEKYAKNENENITKEGKHLWVSWTNKPLFDERGNPSGILAIGTDKTEEKRAFMIIEQSLREKEILLREIHHRVKNNLQIISSILSLQSGYVEGDGAAGVFLDCQNRVDSMAMIHEQLYQSENIGGIDTASYVTHLGSHIISSYYKNPEKIDLRVEAEPLEFTIDKAIPFALITVELLSNSVKYAFPGKVERGIISITIEKREGNAEIGIADNGAGFPEGMNWRETDTLGLKLVRLLTDQLQGQLEAESGPGGVSWKVSFPLDNNDGG